MGTLYFYVLCSVFQSKSLIPKLKPRFRSKTRYAEAYWFSQVVCSIMTANQESYCQRRWRRRKDT